MKLRQFFKCFGMLTISLATGHAIAADFPEKGKRINLLVPFGAGGQIDIMARAMAPVWDKKWGTQTIVLNKTGASGQIALSELLRQPNDGYTIAFTQGFDAQMTYLNTEANAPYSRSNLIPVAMTQRTPAVWIVKSDSPYRSMKDVLEAAKANPEKINFGSPSSRGPAVIYAENIQNKFGAKFNHIPFNDGPSMMNGLMGGHIDLGMINATTALPFFNSGKIRVVMISGDKPFKFFPDVPTANSLGVDASSFGTGLTLAAGTAPAIVSKWSAMIKEVLDDQDLKQKMDAMALILEYSTPEQYSELWNRAEEEATKYLMKVNGKVRPIK
ncbi:Bug family tripartite tricarboxylate transporter substrate binding protein [Alicycliphilus denitrificans]|uniref:Bug family tripartite tricarboxylate transporter substrate binding protein n=1 Tax=Alicycliphilus denitrificans TaxID=179636 RepID=UPI00384B20E0